MIRFDYLIRGGAVYNQALHRFEERDLAISGGRIVRPDPDHSFREIIDARGCIVTPGLIDFHVHCFRSESGINADANSFCCGITTVIDAGSAGASHFPVFYRSDIVNSSVRILADLLVASGGQATWRYPESLDPETFDEAVILEAFHNWPNILVGLKARLSSYVIKENMAEKSVERMLNIAEKARVPLILHITDCAMPLARLAGMLRAGDVICHIYQNRGRQDGTCLGPDGMVSAALLEARRRGVLMDACHGVGNYDIDVCQAACQQGFFPDIISSDNNTNGSFLQPLHSLPKILSKYLDFGMSLEQVIDCATSVPASAAGHPELGTLAENAEADIAIFRLEHKSIHHTDCAGHSYEGNNILIPQMTFLAGVPVYRQADF